MAPLSQQCRALRLSCCDVCGCRYTFNLPDGWDKSTASGDVVYHWLDSDHALLIKTDETLAYVLPDPGAPVSKVVDLTKEFGQPMSTLLALNAWPY